MRRMVKFGRGAEDKYGYVVWDSKCGRFEIKRWEFDIPMRSTEYRLTDRNTGEVYKDCGLLADAKQLANDISKEDE